MLRKLRTPTLALFTGLALLGGHHLLSAQNLATPGEFQVTDAGAASYTIPLYTSPASGNLDVKLALQYNSQSGNGVLGVGWNLSGVSSITRCPKTPAEEYSRIGVQNNIFDVLCLDGQKMRPLAVGSDGLAGSEYRTTRDTYTKIISNGTSGGLAESFTVYTKNGNVMEFGTTPDSRLEHPAATSYYSVWMLRRIKDRFNNTVDFTYSKDTALGEQLLQEVRYNNGKVKISYQARPIDWIGRPTDAIIKYHNGYQFGSTNSRVSKIEIFDEPVIAGVRQLRVFKEYRLGYTQSDATQRSLLTSIQECSANNACLPQTNLMYQNTNTVTFVAGGFSGTGSSSPDLTALGDFEGKGKQSIKAFSPLDFNFGFPSNSNAKKRVIAWDVNSDGITDIGFHSIPEDGVPTYNLVYSSNLNPTLHPYGAPLCYGDIDGRGFSAQFHKETVGVSEGGYRTYLVINGVRTNALINVHDTRCQVVDIDGDGRADVYFPDSVGVIKVTDGVGTQYQAENIWAMQPERDNASPVCAIQIPETSICLYRSYVGDFNGDGKSDMVSLRHGFSGTLLMNLSNGANVNVGQWVPSQAAFGANFDIRCTGDFNGDGRTDLFGFNNGSAKLFLSIGYRFIEVPLPNIPASSFNNIQCGDFNGDGLADIAIDGQYYWSSAPGAIDVLSQVNNGLGHIHKVEYKSITDDSIYTKGAGATYPMVDLQTPMQVVVRTQSGNDTQGWNATGYRYEHLRADLWRKGTLGFAKVTSRNEATDISMASVYRQDYPYIGLKSSTQKYAGAQLLENTVYTYDARGPSGQGSAYTPQYAQVPLVGVETYRYELGSGAFVARSQESYTIDPFGNPTQIVQQQLDAGSNITSRKTTSNSYTNDTSSWLIGQLASASVRSENLRTLPPTSVGSAPSAAAQSGNALLSVSASPNPATAQRSTPGTATVVVSATASGGSSFYSYQWSKLTGSRLQITNPTSRTATFSANLTWDENLTETAKLQVTDSLGAVTSTIVTLKATTPPIFNVSVTPANLSVSANRNNPGPLSANASVTASGGTAPYSYSWVKLTGSRIAISNANTANASFSATLGWGENFTETAQVTISDASGNSVTRNISINFSTPAALVLGLNQSTISGWRGTPGALSGSASVSPTGGTGGYTYSWTKLSGSRISIASPNAAATAFSANLALGENITEYARITVTDSAGNAVSQDVTINFATAAPLVASIMFNWGFMTANCGGPSYSNFATAAGGVPPYQYSWQSTPELSIAPPNTSEVMMTAVLGGFASYSVTVQDAAGNVSQSTNNSVWINYCDGGL
jgi:hypothetical protein